MSNLVTILLDLGLRNLVLEGFAAGGLAGLQEPGMGGTPGGSPEDSSIENPRRSDDNDDWRCPRCGKRSFECKHYLRRGNHDMSQERR